MLEKIEEYLKELEQAAVTSAEELEAFRMRFISRKSVVSELMAGFKSIPNEQKKAFGQKLNALKEKASSKLNQLSEQLTSDQAADQLDDLDITVPMPLHSLGAKHPLTIVRERILAIFTRMGFNLSEGPEIEDDWHNFTALHFPANHPAREMQDTFFIERDPDLVLRTHTSSVQVRVMEAKELPIRTISPGRVYRNEAISARAHCFFHQIEGLYIDRSVSFLDMKQTLLHFVRELFGPDTKIRLRPSYFPFTEPSAELDISCFICKQKGCKICKYTGWVEIGGCGMVDPAVLQNAGIDSEAYTGFAWGMGLERITMLKYQIDDLRLFSENDVRFLRQFAGVNP